MVPQPIVSSVGDEWVWSTGGLLYVRGNVVIREYCVLVPPCVSQNFMHFLRASGDEKRETNRLGYDRSSTSYNSTRDKRGIIMTETTVITVAGTIRVTTMTVTTEL